MTNILLKEYIKDQIFYYNEIDILFEHAFKNNTVNENFLKKISKMLPSSRREKILSVALMALLSGGINYITSNLHDPKEIEIAEKIASKGNRVNLDQKTIKDFEETAEGSGNKRLTPEQIRVLKLFIGIKDSETKEISKKLDNPLVSLFQELLARAENIDEDEIESLEENKESISNDLGIENNNIKKWSQSVMSGENDDIIGIFRQPVKFNQSKDSDDLFTEVGIYELDPNVREQLKSSFQEKINFLRSNDAPEKVINLFTALSTLKLNGVLDGENLNEDLLDRVKDLVGEDGKETLSSYVLSCASSMNNNSDYEEDDY